MKKLIIFPVLAILLSSCSGSNNRVKIEKDCSIYESYSYVTDTNILFFDGKDIPYVNIFDIIPDCWVGWTCKEVDKTKVLITNITGSSYTLNLSTTEVTYDNFDAFIDGSDGTNKGIIFDNISGGLVPAKKIEEESEFVNGKAYSLKLSDFGFTFEKYNDKYYMPIDVLSTICVRSASYYYENKILTILPIEYEGLKEKLSFNRTFTSSYYEHCFNIFMLQEEIMSGLKGVSRKLLSTGEKLTYFEKGVINTLLPYKEKIANSKSIEEFDKGMMEMLKKELNSGGHDNIAERSFNSKQEYLYATEYDVVDYAEADVKEERKKSKDAEDFSKCVYAYDTDSDGKKDIGYITFNRFLYSTVHNEDGTIDYGMKDILLGENGANAILNPKSKTYDSTKYDIKDIVIDLSANGGGRVDTEHLLSAWLCGGKIQQTHINTTTGSYNKLSYIFDVNKDGSYDEQDYIPNDVNIYILTSNGSYSAANSVAFRCSCYNRNNNHTNKIKIMGARPGGGCCCIYGPIYLGTGFGFYQSGKYLFADYKDQSITSEDEIKITEGLELTLSQMANRTGTDGINNLICSKRKK